MVAPLPDYNARKQQTIDRCRAHFAREVLRRAAEEQRIARAFAPYRTLTNADGDRLDLSPSQADSDPRGWVPVRVEHKPLWLPWLMTIGAGFLLAALVYNNLPRK